MNTSDKICTDSCKDSDDVCDVNNMLQNMSMADNELMIYQYVLIVVRRVPTTYVTNVRR